MPDRSFDAISWRIAAYDEIDSTNAEALRRAGQGEHGPIWITAAIQTCGRGRSGRSWTSAPGSLAATLLFAPACPINRLPELALVAGVAAHDAIAAAMSPEARAGLRLKWPNDLLVDGAKVSGILVESTSFGAEVVAAIGIGINVLGLPQVAGRPVAAVAAGGSAVTVDAMSAGLARHLAGWLAIWDGGRNFDAIRTAWLSRSGPFGEAMTINADDGQVAGTFAGLDSDGALLLDVDKAARRRFTFGDVALGAPQA